MQKYKIALTGGIASGKSRVSKIFKGLGAAVIDLDDISRKVVIPGTDGLKELVSSFGSDILNEDKTLNRSMLRKLLIKDKKNKQLIESILHPKIINHMKLEINNIDNEVVIVEIPLLSESDNKHIFDRAIIVDCDESEQLERLMKRDKIDKEEAKSIIATQITREERLNIANEMPTDIIQNSSEDSGLEQKVSTLYDKLIN
jgi:dephospho-CoA kinase